MEDGECLRTCSVLRFHVRSWGFPGGAGGEEPTASAGSIRSMGSIPGSGGFLWRREWQPTPIFLLGKSRGQRSLAATVMAKGESHMAEVTCVCASMLCSHIERYLFYNPLVYPSYNWAIICSIISLWIHLNFL